VIKYFLVPACYFILNLTHIAGFKASFLKYSVKDRGGCVLEKYVLTESELASFQSSFTFLYFSHFWHEKAFSNIKTL